MSSWIGNWIDRAPSRLKPLLLTITINRATVILACGVWIWIVNDNTLGTQLERPAERSTNIPSSPPTVLQVGLFAIAVSLGVLEKISGVGNILSMERDWVPVLSESPECGTTSSYTLTHLNATMRRIDLICKLFAPVAISVLISASSSVRLGVLTVAGMSTTSWGIEVWCARNVWNGCPQLRRKQGNTSQTREALGSEPSISPAIGLTGIKATLWTQWNHLRQYFSINIWIPSLSLAILHLSVLSYAATFLTFLLSSGFSLMFVTIARALSSVVEVSSTIATPYSIRKLSNASKLAGVGSDDEALLTNDVQERRRHLAGLERTGLWGICWQISCLVRPQPLPSIPGPTDISRFQ